MKLLISPVQSVSDIITNSSSEAFIRTSYDGVKIIYDIIDSILKSLGVEAPESFSKNVILTPNKVQITPSSFNLNPIKIINL